jgi:hypothetical protein
MPMAICCALRVGISPPLSTSSTVYAVFLFLLAFGRCAFCSF